MILAASRIVHHDIDPWDNTTIYIIFFFQFTRKEENGEILNDLMQKPLVYKARRVYAHLRKL